MSDTIIEQCPYDVEDFIHIKSSVITDIYKIVIESCMYKLVYVSHVRVLNSLCNIILPNYEKFYPYVPQLIDEQRPYFLFEWLDRSTHIQKNFKNLQRAGMLAAFSHNQGLFINANQDDNLINEEVRPSWGTKGDNMLLGFNELNGNFMIEYTDLSHPEGINMKYIDLFGLCPINFPQFYYQCLKIDNYFTFINSYLNHINQTVRKEFIKNYTNV